MIPRPRPLMQPRPTPRRPLPFRADLARAGAAALAALLVAACAEAPQKPVERPEVITFAPAESGPLLARDAAFVVVVPAAGEDLGSLAERYLGDRSRRFEIAEFNRVNEARAGRPLAIPLAPLNPGGIEPSAVQAVPILCYHRFGPRPNTTTVTPQAFDAQMRYLAQNGYTVIPMAKLASFLEGRTALPKKSVVVTIDDGYRSTYDIAWPILKKYGFPATVYLYTDFVGAPDALTWAQMKEMTAGAVDIQPHSKTHSNLTLRLPGETEARYRDRIRTEVDAAIDVIGHRLGEKTLSYAFPYGDVNDTVVDFLKAKDVRMGVTVTPGGNPYYAPPIMLRRSMIFGGDDLDAFKGKLVTALPVPRP